MSTVEAPGNGSSRDVSVAVKPTIRTPQVRWLERVSPDPDPNFARGQFNVFVNERDPLSHPYSQHPWVFAAVSRIATNVSQVPLNLFAQVEEEGGLEPNVTKTLLVGEREYRVRRRTLIDRYVKAPLRVRLNLTRRPDLVELPTSPWREVLEHPNEELTGTDLVKLTLIWKYVAGDCFWTLEQDEHGTPLEARGAVPKVINVASPNDMTPIVDRKLNRFVGWRQHLGRGRRRFLHRWQVVHHKMANPDHPIWGHSPLDTLQSNLRQDVKAAEYNEAFFDNEGVPGRVILSTEDNLTREQLNALRQQFQDRYRGSAQRGNVLITEGGITAQNFGVAQEDMQFVELAKWHRAAVLAVTGTPESELSIYENLVESNAIVQDRVFWTKTLLPQVRSYETTLHAQLFQRGPVFALFDLKTVPALARVLESQLVAAERLFRLGVPLNEINERLDLGLSDFAWGDEGYAPTNTVTFSSIAAELEEPEAPPSEEEPEGPPDQVSPDSDEEPPPTDEEPSDVPRDPEEELGPQVRTRGERVGGEIWERVSGEILAPSSQRLFKKLGRWFMALRAEQLYQLERQEGESRLRELAEVRQLELEDLEPLLFALATWQENLVTLFRPEFTQIAALTIEELDLELGGLLRFDGSAPELERYLLRREERLRGLVTTIRTALRRTLQQGVVARESLELLQARVRRLFNFTGGESRRRGVTDTEVAQTQGGVRHLILVAEKVRKHVWVRTPDEKVRRDHVRLGRTPPVEVGFNFMKFLGKSGRLLHPSDPEGPLEQVRRCRCIALPYK